MTRVNTHSQPNLLGSSYQKLCAMLLFSILALLMPVSSGVLQAQDTIIHIVTKVQRRVPLFLKSCEQIIHM